MQPDSEAIDVQRALRVLRRRLPLIALCVVVAAGAAFGFSKHQPKKYTASASLLFNSNPLSAQIAGLPGNSVNSTTLLAQETSDVERVKGGDTAAKTARLLGHGLTEAKVSESLVVDGQGESGIVVVSAITTSPTLSADIANAYVSLFVSEQRSAKLHYYKSALAIVDKQLAALPPKRRVGPEGVELEDRAQKLSLLADLKEGGVEVTAGAAVPTSPTSPKTSRNTALGAVLGLLIGLILAFLLERLDRRIRRPEDLEAIYQLPLLGAVPKLGRSAQRGLGEKAALQPAEAEAFSLIRARLRFFNVNRDLRTILIASAEPSDGKTMISRHLAEAAARSGSRVLLLEVDFRNPGITRQLGTQSGPGLADVLIGASPVSEATRTVSVDAVPGEGMSGRTLDVLAAGPVLPPNPGELLESNALAALLAQARSTYDLVVIDTPPLTAVSDAFPLLTKVDGIIVVGRVGHSRRDAAERLHQVLAGCSAALLGVVANGGNMGTPVSYSYSGSGEPAAVMTSVNGAPSSGEMVPTLRA